MDLTLSPDLDAWFCYFIVATVGFVVARGRVSELLTELPGAWLMVETWTLLAVYSLAPLVLFWILDRAGAITDTSLFAAILVSIASRQILAGGVTGMAAPAPIAGAWQPLMAWTDRLAERVRARVRREIVRYQDRVFAQIAADPGKISKLIDLVKSNSNAPADIDKLLSEIAARHAGQGPALVAKKQVSALYRQLEATPDVDHDYALYREGVTPKSQYYWYAREWRSKALTLAVVVIMGLAAIWAFTRLSTPPNMIRYDLWRLTKSNSTPGERQRVRERIARRVAGNDSRDAALTLCSHGAGYLRSETVPLETVESVLSILLSRRHDAARHKVNLPALLTESLRTPNPETRERIQKSLLFLAGEMHKQIAEPLASWRPSKEDSLQVVEERVRQWNSMW